MKNILTILTFLFVNAFADMSWLKQGFCGNSTGPLEFQHDQDQPSLSFFQPEKYKSYVATGQHKTITTVPKGTSTPVVPSLLAWDYENKRIHFNHTNNVHYVYENDSYFLVPAFGTCFHRPDYTYSSWVENWSELNEFNVGADINLFPPSADVEKTHSGWVHDHHACSNTRIQFSIIENLLGAPSKMHWTAPFKVRNDIPGLGGLQFIVTQTSWFDKFEKKCPEDDLFQLPSLCQNAIPFDSFFNCTLVAQ